MRKISFWFFLGLLFVSCIDDIEIDLPAGNEGRLVIEGTAELSPDIYRFIVTVGQTQQLTEPLEKLRQDADIRLMYDGAEVMSLLNGREAIYSIDSLESVLGNNVREGSFNIKVSLPDGSVFTASNQTFIKRPPLGYISLGTVVREELNQNNFILDREYVKVFMNTPVINENEERVSFRWDLTGVYRFPEITWSEDPFFFAKDCYVNDFPPENRVNVLNSKEISTADASEYEIGELIADYRFHAGYYFTVIQKAFGAETAGYWQDVQRGLNREGTIFDAPAGPIRSNISQIDGNAKDVVGYFYTSTVDTLRHLSTQDETGNQPHLCAFQYVSETCCDCLEIFSSSLEKPHYWK